MKIIDHPISLLHGKYELYLFKLKAKDFIQYSRIERRYDNTKIPIQENNFGVQRKLNSKKVSELRNYMLEEDATIPVSFIVNICTNENHYGLRSNAEILNSRIILNSQDLIVIDGQHRLAALDYQNYNSGRSIDELTEIEKKKLDEMEVIIVGYKDISLIDMADIFITINYNQRRVSKSIIYDLLNLVESDFNQITAKQERRFFGGVGISEFRAASIVDDLNNDYNSYWENLVKVEGGRGKTIEKGSFVENLSKIFSKGRIFGDESKNSNHAIYYIILNFYNLFLENLYKNQFQLKEQLSDNHRFIIYSLFSDKDCFLSKPSGVGILFDKDIFDNLVNKTFLWNDLSFDISKFSKYLQNLTFEDFNSSKYKGSLSSRAGYKQVVEIIKNKMGI